MSAFNFFERGKVKYLKSAILDDCDFVTHAFCTRQGGVSEGNFKDLNLSPDVGDKEENVLHNLKILASSFDIPVENFFTVNQVHGDGIIVVDKKILNEGRGRKLDFDGIISNTPGIAMSIKTADCVPIIMVDYVNRVVGAFHAGWKGTSLGIVPKAVGIFSERFSSAASNIFAAIGPAIGPCCYEVDEKVADSMKNMPGNDLFLRARKKRGKWMLDLSAANRFQMLEAGIPRENIATAKICTACRSDLFFSYRKEGVTGRQFSFVMLK